MKLTNICVLGSTGSIGQNTLDVVARHPECYRVHSLVAHINHEKLTEQCQRFRPQYAVMLDANAAQKLAQHLDELKLHTRVLSGKQAIDEMAAHTDVDIVMAAIVGVAGLSSCLAAAKAGKRLLLANKEALVVGGDFFMNEVAKSGATLLPIDSEHSAIFQSLPQDFVRNDERVDKIYLTASGGAFRQRDPHTFASITIEEACHHPNWRMGRKITVDSATMMNKALEVIEAHFLFGIAPEKIEVLIHPQSIVHSMVQYVDGSIVAQLGSPDMRCPIAYGLAHPGRITSGAAKLDVKKLSGWMFESLAEQQDRYPCLNLAWQALNMGPGYPAVLNAANEIAVDAFLDKRLRFDKIFEINQKTLLSTRLSPPKNMVDLLSVDQASRAKALEIMATLS